MAPTLLNLATIGDLFGVSRLMIAEASNISSPASPLLPDQTLFVPITCSCNSNSNLSYVSLTYTIKKGDTFYQVSTYQFQNLTTYQYVEFVNPTIIPTNLEIGVNVVFPIFSRCPRKTQLQNTFNYLITYVFQPSDTLSSITERFGLNRKYMIDINGENILPFDTVFLPVSRVPSLAQPSVLSPVPYRRVERKRVVVGLAVWLGISGFLLIILVLVIGLWVYPKFLKQKKEIREGMWKQQKLKSVLLVLVIGLWVYPKFLKQKKEMREGIWKQQKFKRVETLKGEENFMADVSDFLDKYKVYGIEEVIEATDVFNLNYLIQGSVYKGCIDGEF